MHPLLARQLRRFGGDAGHPPAQWAEFVAAVDRAYADGDADRALLERSMELVSEELSDANQTLNLERDRLEQSLRLAPAAIAVYTGSEHRITMANDVWRRLTGRGDEVVGMPFREVFPELEETGLFTILDDVYRSGEPFVGREIYVPLARRGDAELEATYWDFVWQPLRGRDGVVREILLHAVEITDQVRARREVEEKASELARLARELERSNRDLDQFAYIASHDLRTPLRGISNLSEWIEEDLGGECPAVVAGHLRLLRSRAHRLDAMVDGLLKYARIGRDEETVEPVDATELVRGVVDLLQPGPGVEVAVGRLPVLEAPRLPLQQVFLNLIGNACKYASDEAPRIEVTARREGDAWEFSVRDNGPGIAPEFHSRVFGLFQRLESHDESEGAGLGLALVKRIVEAHGGRVWVNSAPGEGSDFRFVWPEASDIRSERRATPEPEARRRAAS